jgi:micrococcal nuclease
MPHKSRQLLGSRIRRWLLIAVLSIAAVGLLYRMLRPYFEEPPPAPRADEPVADDTEPARLLRVIDGDTIEVRWRGGTERVRLLRINTPERGRRGYDEATAALERLLEGADLALEFERPGRPERDKYDRLLAYVRAGDQNANVEMVRLGWTRFWTRYGAGRHAELLAAAEDEARSESAGLWGPNGWNRD